ncbi:hypothetical protein EHQ61_06365 [Leptospira wolffii]|uniref:hypothetical protein n=1 Tax=Leptospira wolffii TaxID=409998 RepID=UPI00031FE67F|nr:hypothetical protein [Leptospira wolffii]EPG65344.1 hypothetical protein LEP1GSC061_2757 [Leptospira wolffii serovar Khorat str. Khorat-H2]TGL52682.1 hypothetical protein EHQ61_06365 [Leptospira wolffii]
MEKGLSLKDLADALEKEFGTPYNPNLLGKVERGQSRLLAHDFLVLCQFFKLELKIFFDKEKKFTQDSVLGDLTEDPAMRRILVFLSENKNSKGLVHFLEEFLRYMSPSIIRMSKDQESKNIKAASPKKKGRKT